MAKIAPALQKLIDDGVVKPPSSVNLAFVSRRQRLNWLIADGTTKPQTFRTVVASTERMNDRAAMGLSFDEKSMAKVARPQKVQPKAPKVRAKAAPKPAKPAVPKVTKKTKAAAVPKSVPAAPVPTPATPPASATASHLFLIIDRSRSMEDNGKQAVAQKQINDITAKINKDCGDFDVEVCGFDHIFDWKPVTKGKVLTPYLLIPRGNTRLYDIVADVSDRAIKSSLPCLIYLITDGENWGSNYTASMAVPHVAAALATGRVTFACVGPAAASSFFKSCGIPDACIRRWDGNDAADLAVVTQQATAGVEQFVKARKEGRTKLDSFFVDVVAQGITVEKAKKQLRDITSSLRVRKISKFEEMQPYVETELKRQYVPGAGYYQLQKTETLKVGRRIILQPRGEQVFLAGPAVRSLLGLPEDRDVKLELKNLGDFVVYVQSASKNRKLLPGTQFLYDESHVAGATAPTWSYANGGGAGQGNGTAGKGQ